MEAFFSDGSPARGAEVEVRDARSGAVLLRGHTDAQGAFEFSPPRRADLRVVVTAELGHRAECSISREELPAAPAAGTAAGAVDLEALRRVLAAELRPLREALARMERRQSRPSWREAVGGIGYIVGIFGAMSWCLRRKRDV